VSSEVCLSDEDETSLFRAVELIEQNTLGESILGVTGAVVSGGLTAVTSFIPDAAKASFNDLLTAALRKSFDVVLLTIDKKGTGLSSSGWFARASVALSGGVGGFFGLAGTTAELPVTTALLMRAIAQVAVRCGEDLSTDEARLECLKIFALGGMRKDGEDEGYYAARMSLAGAIPTLAQKTLQDILPRAVAAVAERFSIPMTFKLGSQLVPGIGAVAGVLLNSAFADHFERKAQGHFTVRRLERAYGLEVVQMRFEVHQATVRRRHSKRPPKSRGA
jgi:hypothetical protein